MHKSLKTELENINIDRNQFYRIYDDNIIHLNETTIRTVNRGEYKKYVDKVNDGINSITKLKYEYDIETNFINVFEFNTPHLPNTNLNKEYDLKNGNTPFKTRVNPRMKMAIN